MAKTLLKIAAILWCTSSMALAAPAEVFDYGRFGEVSVYRGSAEPRDVVLFLSGDAGWFKGALSIGFCPDLDLKRSARLMRSLHG